MDYCNAIGKYGLLQCYSKVDSFFCSFRKKASDFDQNEDLVDRVERRKSQSDLQLNKILRF